MITTKDQWFHERLAHHRATTPHSGASCHRCQAPAEWREIDERGNETPGHEWAYCSGCGQRLRGETSAWYELAREDWQNHPYMHAARRQRHIDRRHRAIKLGVCGRRKTIFENA